ncbi:MAG: hypothetical protein R2568_01765 [Candidatus Scalindua sp.]|jgi:hypothetical protein|nr:hypothetical protein [Candidatus Scalindua sp.]MDV5165456.1 hypothetical protein [Candidatus Scalindua sp.]
MKIKHIQNILIILIIISSVNKTSFAIGKIVNYFLDNPNAWDDTKRVTRSTPTKVVIKNGMEGLVFKLTDLTPGDVVALVFLEAKKVEKFSSEKSCDAGDKLVRGKNRIVSVITKNHGNRKEFHYRFLLQREMNRMPIDIFNDGDAVLESSYDGTEPVVNMSDLSGIKLLEIEVR